MSLELTEQQKKHYGKVAVLLGGFSAEREISLMTGQAVFKSLKAAGVDVYTVDPKIDGLEVLIAGGFDRIWIALHGRGGEDGQIQGWLQQNNLPYTGSGVMASAIAMDKFRTKLIWSAAGLPVAKDRLVTSNELNEHTAKALLAEFNGCVMVKPVCEGSSVGMAKVSDEKALLSAVKSACEYDQEIMLEQWIDGEEYTVAILNEHVLPSIRMTTPNDFYDFEAKYKIQTTEYFCPSGLEENDESELARLAKKAYEFVGAKGCARVDFLRDKKTKGWILLEINTIPGMTETSLVPKAAKVFGMSFTEVALNILDSSFIAR